MATARCFGKEHSVPGVWTELSLWIPGGEHQILLKSWEEDAGIPDRSSTTPTSGFAACVSPEGDRLGTILPPPVLFCTGVCWSHCPGGELWESEQEGDEAK